MSKVNRFEVDKLTSMDADYPPDDSVPELPPVPDAVNPPPPPDNWNWSRFNDDNHPQKADYAPPLTAIVTEENPLKASVCWSMRSPYSYLTLQRLTWLNSNSTEVAPVPKRSKPRYRIRSPVGLSPV